MQRRAFLKLTAGIAALTPILQSCDSRPGVAGNIVGASSQIGHLLRDKPLSQPLSVVQKDIVIVGGGVSGLSAARWLQMNGVSNMTVLDLEPQMGGNAAFGHNSVSAFPWGAHYITIPNNNLTEYLDFLKECNVITGNDSSGLPIINEYYLCQDPQERLFLNGQWQDGLVPQIGVSKNDRDEVRLFIQKMDFYKNAIGKDGKVAFAIPVDTSSRDEEYTALDRMTMKVWMEQQGFKGSYLFWYVNYCTRDDFGTAFDVISAWAGIHYFAGRKGKAANAEGHNVITWPEGNGWLCRELQRPIVNHLKNGALAVSVTQNANTVTVQYYDVITGEMHAIEAKQCILATPQFVNNRLLVAEKSRSEIVTKHLHYAPWMVANLLVTNLKERSGQPLSWDNVLYNSKSLGYVKANQQLISQNIGVNNLTYYLPLTDEVPAIARKKVSTLTHKDWMAYIFKDLQQAHPNISEATRHLDIMIWGHAMAQPLPNLMHGSVRPQLQQSIGNNLHFAHTDLAGISIFEEAFYQGLTAAKKVLAKVV